MDELENKAQPEQENEAPVVSEAPEEQKITQVPSESAPMEKEPQPEVYHNLGTGRKESPFADSPYVMQHEPAQPPKAKKVKKQRSPVWKSVVVAILTVALVACSCGITASFVNNRWEAKTEEMNQQFNDRLAQMQAKIDSATDTVYAIKGNPDMTGQGLPPSQVYALNKDAVVAINCMVSDGYNQGTSAGSGFIISDNGYVVTNHHVIEGAVAVTVIMNDGTEYEAQIVGSDSVNDIGVLKLEAEGLPYVAIGSSDDVIVGDQVVAVGNALGELASTMTVGYISGKDRDVSTDGTIINMLQTDASINSGNSGGPLFNMYGQVIGITTAKYSGTSSSGATIEGIGFAIPIDDVAGMIEDLVEYGYITGAYLGVMVSNMDMETADIYGLPVGAYVVEVTPGYCAEAAGLQAKDIILKVGDTRVETITDLTRALREYDPGDTTTLTVYRGGREITLTVTLDAKPQTTEQTQPEDPEEEVPMPSDGDYNAWYEYFKWRYGLDKED